MTPLQDLLTRIRWDPQFGRGVYEITYIDRFTRQEVRLPLGKSSIAQGISGGLQLNLDNGETPYIPLHRIRKVYRNCELIWERPTVQEGKG